MLKRLLPAEVKELGELEVEIRMMTAALARDGHVIVPAGVVLDNYRLNPIQLWQHDPMMPVGRNEDIRVEGEAIIARTVFPPAGVSAKADEIRGLVKAGIINAVSIGFDPIETEPLDPKKPRAGQRMNRWELFECSFVSVPADPKAVITARANGEEDMAEWKCGASRDLPIEDGDPAWDGSAAEKSIFEWAGGDDFDAAKARRGFLAYDAEKPKERGSYKLPIAHVVDGKLVVPKSAIRAASGAHGVQAADIGDAKDAAQAVLDHYKEKAGIGERRRRPSGRRQHARDTAPPRIRGMYEVGCLAWVLANLCNVKWCADWEKEIEGDDSKVPAMLAEALQLVGEALVAMTEEEVAEILAEHGPEVDIAGLADAEVEEVRAAKSPALQRFLVGKFRARAAAMANRAGKALSAANADKLAEAEDHHAKALDHHGDAVEAHANLGEYHRDMAEACRSMQDAYDEMACEDGDRGAAPKLKRAATAMGRHLNAMTDALAAANDEHEAMGDSHRGIARSIRAAGRVLRSLDGYGGEGSKGANSTVQKSDGVQQDEGSRSLDYRTRQVELEQLRGAPPVYSH